MHFSRLSLASLAASEAAAVSLWAASYGGAGLGDGGVASLKLDKADMGGYTLKQTSFLNGSTSCGAQSSWLTKDAWNNVIYCVDEAWGLANGSVTSFHSSANGSLALFDKVTTIGSPVSTVVYNGGAALAAAHYDTSSVTTFSILPSGGLKAMQTFQYKLAAPGPNPTRQDVPHEHEVILDPTGSFIVVPDLGADLLRIFAINKTTSLLSESSTFAVAPGSGPRHGAFLKTDNATYLFIISELANTIASYSVAYTATGLSLTQVFISGAYGVDVKIPTGAGAAEAILSPDHKYLLTSERHVASFQIANFDPKNSTTIPSDALIAWTIDHATGKLSNAQRAPAGGMNPRQFSVNAKGDLAAVGLQDDGRVVILERRKDGSFGDILASIVIPGSPTSVIWDE
jgi:6-phosphogluconolactonase (cycloisomerase 2 family)